MRPSTIDQALEAIGTGPFQRRLLAIFGLVWAADAMQVLAIGFAAPSLAASFGPSGNETVWVVRARRSLRPATPTSRAETPSASLIWRTTASVFWLRLVKVTYK